MDPLVFCRNSEAIKAMTDQDSSEEIFRDLLNYLGEAESTNIDLSHFYKCKMQKTNKNITFKVLNTAIKLRSL